MKKNLLSAVLCMLCIAQGYAQTKQLQTSSRSYIRVGAGYSLPFNPLTLHGRANISGKVSQTSNSYSYQAKKFSFGAGANATAAFGYMLNDNLGLELGVMLGFLNKKYSYTNDGYVDNENHYHAGGTLSQKLRWMVIPSVVVQAPLSGSLLYLRAGAVLSPSNKIDDDYSDDRTVEAQRFNVALSARLETKPSIGVQTALGIKFPLDGGAFWIEANMISMTAYAKKHSIRKYTVDGYDVMGQLTVSQKETEYTMDYNITGNSSPNQPAKAETFAIPYSNIGLAMGFSFDL